MPARDLLRSGSNSRSFIAVISPEGNIQIFSAAWRKVISKAERKKNVSRRADEERRISPYTGRVLAVRAPLYVVLHPRAEIRRSSSARRDTSFFIMTPGYVILHPCAEIRSTSTKPSICA